LRELLFPGTRLLLEHAADESRRTRFTCVGVEGGEGLIPLHTGKTNDLVAELLRAGAIPRLGGWDVVRREVPVPHGRMDFLLARKTERYYLEVKSCTLFAAGGAFFPDAVTERGRRHLLALEELRSRRVRSGVMFVAYSDRCRYFLPDWHTDPRFARALLAVKDVIDVMPVAVSVGEDLAVSEIVKDLPVPWDVVGEELGTGGVYALVLRLPRRRVLTCGGLGRVTFRPGFYVYTGSGHGGLDARLARHTRRRKRLFWHIDYLREAANVVTAYPIRTPRQIECSLAASVRAVAERALPGFGSSDCGCTSHLFYFRRNPEELPAFVKAMLALRFQPAFRYVSVSGPALQ
jgi:sugar fermentation stimulation protein A